MMNKAMQKFMEIFFPFACLLESDDFLLKEEKKMERKFWNVFCLFGDQKKKAISMSWAVKLLLSQENPSF